MKLTVVHLEGSKQGLTETLMGQVISVGRDPSNTLSFDPFKDLDVSTRHASVTIQGGQPILQDLGSTNGTFLNGSKIQGAVPMPNGCLIQFGENGPKLQATYSLDDGPGKKTKMIHDLSLKLDDAGQTRSKEKKRNLIILLVVVLLGVLVGVGYGLHSSSAAAQKLKDESAQLKKRAEQQRSQAEALDAPTTKVAQPEWEAAVASMEAAAEAEKLEDYGKAKEHYQAALDGFQKAGAASSNASLLALKGQLEEASAQAKNSQAAREQKDKDDRERLDAQNATMLATIRKELEQARGGAKLMGALEKVDLGDPKQVDEAITQTEAAIKDMDPESPERKELEAKLEEMKTAKENLGNAAERLKAAAEAAKPKTVAIRSRVFALPKGQTLETTKIRITVAEGIGTGFFASKDGKVITAKEVVYPELFDPKAAALHSKLDEKGMQFFRELEVLTPVKTSTATVYTATYTSDKVSVARKPDDAWGDKQKVTIRFDNADVEVTVRTHARGDSDVIVLKVEGAKGEALELAASAPKAGQVVAALGTQKREDGSVGLFRFDGQVKEGDAVLSLELPSFSSWIGGPLINPEGKVVGILTSPDLKASKAVSASAFRRYLE